MRTLICNEIPLIGSFESGFAASDKCVRVLRMTSPHLHPEHRSTTKKTLREAYAWILTASL
jgi:hypothetical protein